MIRIQFNKKLLNKEYDTGDTSSPDLQAGNPIFYYDFLKLTGISVIFGIPAIRLGMNLWLEDYAYRIDFPWLAVVLSVFIVILFTFLVIGYQTYRVAVLNPSQTFTYE